jgi:heme A synthase
MGGFRVTEQSLFLATVHGVFGQGFFALLVVIVAVTSAKWRAVASALGNDDSTTPSPDNAKQLRAVRMWAWIVFASVFLQVVLGAVLRHFGGTWIPHVLWAFVLAILLLALSNAVFMNPASRRWLGASVVAQMLVFGLQLMLGLVTLLVVLPMESTVPTTWAQAWLPTLHQGTGAVLVGLSAYLAVMASGLVAALGRTRGERLPSSSTPGETTASVSGSEALVS